MAIRTYTVGDKSGVRRLDELTGPWVDVPLNLAPLGAPIDVILRDVMTDPVDSNKVFVVGGRDRDQGAYGIYVSANGGAVWSQPGGDITSPLYDFNTFWEVWVVDSNTIYACADNGFIFKSTDGGATFNKTATLPTSDGNPDNNFQVQAIHFISADTGIIGTSANGAVPEVWKTIDGGATWTRLNGDNFLSGAVDPDEIVGIHLSADEQVINVTGDRRQIRSVDAGANFTGIVNFQALGARGRHLTWRDDDNLWIIGSGSYRAVSTDAGATVTVLNPFFALSPDQRAGHLFTDDDGFFDQGYDILQSSDQLATGLLSETSPYGIEAVWTLDDNPPPEPCGCPEGTIYNPATELCEGFETMAATLSGTIYPVEAGQQATSYGWGGTNFYENVDSLPQPISSNGGVMQDATNSPLVIQQNVSNSVWGDVPTATALTTILNTSGVWSSTALDNEWIGFTACVNAPQTKVYYVGLAADNLARFKVNGQTIVEFEGCSNTFNFNYWHVFPITLQAGDNIIEMEGRNCSSVAAFAAEIYDATLSQLTSMTLQAQLDAVKIFTTQDQIGNDFHSGESSGYSCPPGWALSLCDGAFTCARTLEAPFIPCNCYLAMDCEDPTITMLVTTQDPLDLNSTYKFEGSDQCWTVIESDQCEFNAPIINVTETHPDCRFCLGLCYILTDCEGNETDIKTDVDLSAYVGQVIQITTCPDVCWQVSEAPDCDGTLQNVNFVESFADCDTCLPPPPEPEPVVLRPRAINPGIIVKACSADYIEEVECRYAEIRYQEVVSKRYGIEFCCKDERRKWHIKHELLKLDMIHDPNVCPNPTPGCCVPTNVSALFNS